MGRLRACAQRPLPPPDHAPSSRAMGAPRSCWPIHRLITNSSATTRRRPRRRSPRWREERAHGHEGDEAVVRAMATAGRAVVFSGTTVAIGLLAMIVLPLPFLRSIGYAGMLIPLISVIVASTLLPVVLVKFGNRLDWPHVRTDDKASRSWTSWAQLVVRRRWVAALGAALVLAALVLAATSLQPGTPNVDTLSKSGD